MDMHVELPTPLRWCADPPFNEYARLAKHRQRMLALICEFRQAVARPRGRRDAIRILKELLPCSGAYFAVVESLLDRISVAGATPHQDDHRRILNELECNLTCVAVSNSERTSPELLHAIDALVIHEATICLRAPENRPPTR